MNDWQPIETAPATGTFIVAAWSPSHGRWFVGEAERDPEDADAFWWVNDRGTYTGETLICAGMQAKRWQPLPEPPTGEP